MLYSQELFGITYEFASIKEVLAHANEEKAGDRMAGIASDSVSRRIAAKQVLSKMTLELLYNNPMIPYDEDEVTRVIIDGVNQQIYESIKIMTVGALREYILKGSTEEISQIQDGLTAEMIAGVTKLMSNMDLVYAAAKMPVSATCNTTIGLPQTLSYRLQPNHQTDSVEGILASTKEGLLYGSGDAVIGVNPSTDKVDNVIDILRALDAFVKEYKIPTQNCVLAHITTQIQALKKGAPMDLMFQSIAGSQVSNEAFGINIELLDEGYELMKKHKNSTGPNFMYFETGQGSALSSEGHFDTDQVTMEARCYGLAKRYKPFLVNTVVGFIGPEYLYDGRQIIRAGLEDHFMGKLSGLPMGVDVCYTNHADSDQNDNENLAMLLAMAGCNFMMGVPGTDDIMLMYQSTSFHDGASLREILHKRPIKAFEQRMEELGILRDGKLVDKADKTVFGPINEEGETSARINIGHVGARMTNDTYFKLRGDHSIARDAVWNDSDCLFLDELKFIRTQTIVKTKEEYVRRPDHGRCFDDETIEYIKEQGTGFADVQIIAADGLSPVAIEANMKEMFNEIKKACIEKGYSFGKPIFVKYGRVATMDKISAALNSKVTLLFIGERPGLATDESMSCYMAYESSPNKPESQRNVVSNIYSKGLIVHKAAKDIMNLTEEMFKYKMSGTQLNEKRSR